MARLRIFRFEFSCLILAFLSTLCICNPVNDHGGKGNNAAIDPCTDFYGHVCARELAPYPNNADAFVLGYEKMEEEMESLIREISKAKDLKEDHFSRKLSDYYLSCRRFATGGSTRERLDLLFSFVSTNGGWPLTLPLNGWKIDDKKITLQKIHESYAEIVEHPALFDIRVRVLSETTGPTHMIRLEAEPRKINTNNVEGILNVATIFSEEQKSHLDAVNAKKEITDMLHFGESLSQLASGIGQTKTTIAAIQTGWDKQVAKHPAYSINWLDTVQKAFEKTGIKIEQNQKIFIKPHDFLNKLGDLLIKTDPRTVVNYVHWSALADLAPYADAKIEKYITGVEKVPSCSRSCLNGPINDHGMYSLYIKKYFKDSAKRQKMAGSIVSALLVATKDKISKSAWIPEKMKARFQHKFSETTTNIGYPAWYDDADAIDKYMDSLKIGTNYMKNIINHNVFRKKNELQKLNKGVDKHEWTRSPLIPGAWYNLPLNTINLPIILLRDPFFNVDKAKDSGALKFIVGHEIAHGIDPEGQLYTKLGVKEDLDKSYEEEYNKIGRCYVDQYNNYKMYMTSSKEYIPVHGECTFNENFADNVGVRLAWDAFPEIQKDPKKFFFSITKPWCSADQDPNPYADPHARSDVRFNGIVSNMPEFSKTFKCKPGSAMEPEKRCDFWLGNIFPKGPEVKAKCWNVLRPIFPRRWKTQPGRSCTPVAAA